PPPLLILDLNGTLIYRKKPNSIIRPYVNEFFDYIFSKESIGSKEYPNWEVMIWSSAQKHNVRMMCDLLGIEKRESSVTKNHSMNSNHHHHQTGSKDDILSNFENLTVQSNDRIPQSNHHRDLNIKRSVIEIWDRSQMNLSQKDFNRKVSTTKDLNSIWTTIKYLDPYDQSEYQYGPKNTIIIDDSLEKLSLQPYNLCQIQEFKGSREDNELLEMIKTLKQIKLQSNFSSYLKHKKNQDQLSTNKLNDQELQDRSES
ncbi:HAD-like domain-containing protein, partial [Melampsora americana]